MSTTPVLITKRGDHFEAMFTREVAMVSVSYWFRPTEEMVEGLTFAPVRGQMRSVLWLESLPPSLAGGSEDVDRLIRETALALGVSLPKPTPLTDEEKAICRTAFSMWQGAEAAEGTIRAQNPQLHYQSVTAHAQGSASGFFARHWETLRRGGWGFATGRCGATLFNPPAAGASSGAGRIPFRLRETAAA